jgi:hypothetical protein
LLLHDRARPLREYVEASARAKHIGRFGRGLTKVSDGGKQEAGMGWFAQTYSSQPLDITDVSSREKDRSVPVLWFERVDVAWLA